MKLGTKLKATKDFPLLASRGGVAYQHIADIEKGMDGVVCGHHSDGGIIVSIPLYGITCGAPENGELWEIITSPKEKPIEFTITREIT